MFLILVSGVQSIDKICITRLTIRYLYSTQEYFIPRQPSLCRQKAHAYSKRMQLYSTTFSTSRQYVDFTCMVTELFEVILSLLSDILSYFQTGGVACAPIVKLEALDHATFIGNSAFTVRVSRGVTSHGKGLSRACKRCSLLTLVHYVVHLVWRCNRRVCWTHCYCFR